MEELRDWFAMGGYGFYVWSAYGVTLVLLGIVGVSVNRQLVAARKQYEALKRLLDKP